MFPNSNRPSGAPSENDQEQSLPWHLKPIPPLIQRSQEAFQRDLPQLLKSHYRQWVAYHGDHRIGFSRSKTKLVHECLCRGLPLDQFVVRSIEPAYDLNEEELEIRPSYYLDDDAMEEPPA